MKKLLSILLTLSLCFSLCALFSACDEGVIEEGKTADTGVTEEGKTADTGVTKEEWKAMLSESNFENYTMTQSQTVTYAPNQTVKQDVVFKVAGDKASAKLNMDGEHAATLVYEGEEAAMQKGFYEQIYRGMLAEFDNYVYDSEKGGYKIEKEITVDIPAELYNMTIKITMRDAFVKLSEDGRLLEFECDFTQENKTSQGVSAASAEALWTFSDYGTTVITETAE